MTAATPSTVAVALAIAARRWEASATLARLDGRDAERARSLVATAATLDEVGARAARPPGWAGCDPSWIDAALAGLDPAARAIAIGDRDDPLARWLARRAFGHLAPMPPLGPATTVDELARLTARQLARTLAAIGRRQLVYAVAGSAASDHAALIRRLPWGADFAGELAAVRSLGDRAADLLGGRRAATARTLGLTWTDAIAPMVAGLRAIAAPVSEHGDLAQQIGQRLPRPIGLRAIAELTGPFAQPPADPVAATEIQRAIAHGSVGP